VASANRKDGLGYIPPAKYPVVHQAALEACDAQDGLKDGLIGNPAKCKFDPKTIECKGGDGPSCLTSAQVETARKIYSNGTNPRTGQTLFPSYPAGSELGWYSDPSPNIVDQYKYVAFKNPDWDWKTFDFDKDFAASEKPEYLAMNATDPNLSKFFGHNGKLLLYHGWADTNVSPYLTIQYYKSVVDTMGGEKKAADSVRLFLEPGMGHCGGGEGPNKFDKVSPMEAWVEKGVGPEKMIASHATAGKVDRTRPLCPYPQVAKYKGSGSVDDAANFSCVAGL
jgi:feruloyl esterase